MGNTSDSESGNEGSNPSPAANREIFVSGCARSGTSLVAGIINRCGAFGGNFPPSSRYNQQGIHENFMIQKHLIKKYLKYINCDELGQYPLPNTDILPSIMDLYKKFYGIMEYEGYLGGPVFYKDAKLALIWPLWIDAFPNAQWVLVKRDIKEIIQSCKNAFFMITFNTEEHWESWINEYWDRLETAKKHINYREIEADTIIKGDLEEIKDTIKWLGLTWTEEAEKFINPALWGYRPNKYSGTLVTNKNTGYGHLIDG